MTKNEDFETWWQREGGEMQPKPNEDTEEFAKRITEIAWKNGAFVAAMKVTELLEMLKEFDEDQE